MIHSWWRRYRIAVLATAVFMPPLYQLAVADATDRERLLIFLLEGMLLSCLCEALRRARRKADAAAAALAHEVQERQKLEAALERRVEELAQADRARDQFLAMLAHELRNPIGAISNALHLLKQRSSDDPRLINFAELQRLLEVPPQRLHR